MKHLLTAFSVLALAICASSHAAPTASETKPTAATVNKPYRHAVFFKFKDDAKPEAIKAVETAFIALKEKIPAVKSLEWGTNVSPEGLAQGYTHAFFLTFENKAALETGYLHHPDHKAFGAILKPILDKVFVFDYVAE